MFSFASLFSLLEAAPGAISTAESVGYTVSEDFKAIMANPAVQQLEALIAKNFTATTTPGSAAVIEPKATAPLSGK